MLQGAPRRLVLAAVLFVAGFGVAFAQAEKVYVTRTGTKYHRESCSSLRSSKIEMPLAEAAARYGPCANCRPPVPAAVRQPPPAETVSRSLPSFARREPTNVSSPRPRAALEPLPSDDQEGDPVLPERPSGQ